MERSTCSGCFTFLAAVLAFLLCIPGCDSGQAPDPPPHKEHATQPTVYTVNYPLYYFARRIAGGHARIVLPAPPDSDPAYWQPDQHTVAAYQKADLILLNGAGYAGWVHRSSLPPTRTVNTSLAFSDRYRTLDDVIVHSHGPEGAHEHGSIDFTTWLDPKLAIAHAAAVKRALEKLLPEKKEILQQNSSGLEQDLKKLDRRLEMVFTSHAGRPFIASHPVYNYLAARYGLTLESLHWEPGEMPAESEWRKLAGWFDDRPRGIMLWEGPPCKAVIERMNELGIPYCVFQPCGNRPTDGDYLDVMDANIAALNAVE